ncbi:MAG TPA: replication initiator protein A [Verrucomicrobiota bacterium]|nr:replication initiator protein A [Verrucomicrobiales bacterium]HRI11525.1 replication initiator protein A [Verrucomicrobiota bacterium]
MNEELEEPPRQSDGKDEMNLAEFPLSAIADRLDPEQKTMVFEDRVWDRNRGEMVPRQLLITAADAYGLPTARDDEVILGLVQLSRLQGFSSRTVTFTRYQLIQLLGWRPEGKSYERIEKSLNRWMGVTLYYQNAWWDRKNECWVDEKFHLLDNVTLVDRERRAAQRAGQTELFQSTFSWNEVVFRSFSAGNLKSLDFDFYKRLDSPVAKRLYRFLDKRFFHRTLWEFHLQELCWAHVGLARSYDTANLKRKLRPAIAELESKGFLTPLTDEVRFRRVSCGEWRVAFERSRPHSADKRTTDVAANENLRQALVQRGVTPSTSSDLVREFPSEKIEQQLEVLDWLVARKDPRVERNPPGYLVSAIRGEYVAPREFKSRQQVADAAARAKAAEDRRQAQLEKERQREEGRLAARRDAASSFWASLSDEERSHLEHEALASAGLFEQRLLREGGSLAEATRQKILEDFALRSLEATAWD